MNTHAVKHDDGLVTALNALVAEQAANAPKVIFDHSFKRSDTPEQLAQKSRLEALLQAMGCSSRLEEMVLAGGRVVITECLVDAGPGRKCLQHSVSVTASWTGAAR